MSLVKNEVSSLVLIEAEKDAVILKWWTFDLDGDAIEWQRKTWSIQLNEIRADAWQLGLTASEDEIQCTGWYT